MPKLPKSVGGRQRGNGHAGRSKDGARASGKPGASGRKPTATTRTKRNGAKREAKAVAVDYAHRPVDQAAATTEHTAAVELNEFERGLLGDLFAVIEEHDDASARRIDRALVERAFVFRARVG